MPRLKFREVCSENLSIKDQLLTLLSRPSLSNAILVPELLNPTSLATRLAPVAINTSPEGCCEAVEGRERTCPARTPPLHTTCTPNNNSYITQKTLPLHKDISPSDDTIESNKPIIHQCPGDFFPENISYLRGHTSVFEFTVRTINRLREIETYADTDLRSMKVYLTLRFVRYMINCLSILRIPELELFCIRIQPTELILGSSSWLTLSAVDFGFNFVQNVITPSRQFHVDVFKCALHILVGFKSSRFLKFSSRGN